MEWTVKPVIVSFLLCMRILMIYVQYAVDNNIMQSLGVNNVIIGLWFIGSRCNFITLSLLSKGTRKEREGTILGGTSRMDRR